jgi:hypothetical protein
MTSTKDHRILTINSGSSSLKIALFLMGKKETDLHGGHWRKHAGNSPPHLPALGVSRYSS